MKNSFLIFLIVTTICLIDANTIIASNAANASWVDVRSYGAKGDGINDDTTAIQASINAASVTGNHIVKFPAGKYKITSTIYANASISIIGDGPGLSIIKPTGVFKALDLKVNNDRPVVTTKAIAPINIQEQSIQVVSAKGIEPGMVVTIISNMEWHYETGRGFKKGEIHIVDRVVGKTLYFRDGTFDSYAAGEVLEVIAYNAATFIVKDFSIEYQKNTNANALSVSNAIDANIYRVSISGASSSAFGTNRSVGVTFDGCTVKGANKLPNGFGFSITNSNNVRITNSKVEASVWGVDLGTGIFPCRNNALYNSTIIGGGVAADGITDMTNISTGAESHGAAENVSFVNNKFINCHRGILVKGSNTSVSNNEFVGIKHDVIYFQHGANLHISNNIMWDFNTARVDIGSTYSQKTKRFITVGSAAHAGGDLIIINNKILVSSRVVHIEQRKTFTLDRLFIQNNIVELHSPTRGESVSLIVAEGSVTLVNSLLMGNTYIVGQGILIYLGSNISVDVSSTVENNSKGNLFILQPKRI